MGYKVKRIMVGDKQVRPYKWYPGSNTIAYFPFKSDALDVTGNNTLTSSGTQDGYGRKFTSNCNITTPSGTIEYVNYWIKINNYPTSGNIATCLANNKGMGYYSRHGTSWTNKAIIVWYNSSFAGVGTSFAPTTGTWHNISYGYDGTKMIYSIDGVIGTLYNGNGYNFGATFIVSQGGDITIGDLILETSSWSSDKIQSYYNSTKSNYGL